MERERAFTIGQFAALHGVNKKTLMWYDEMELFKPAGVAENGYRFYTYGQSQMLETILMLRELDMSIPEIRAFLQERSAENYVELLRGKLQDVDEKIARLKGIRKSLAEQNRQFTGLLHADLSRMDIMEQEEEYLYIVAGDDDLSPEDEIGHMIASVRKHNFKSLHDTTYGSLICVQNLLDSEFSRYAGLFMKAPGTAARDEVHVKPKGSYLRAYCQGSWDRLPDRYKEILEYARGQDMTLYGYAYETGINEMTISSMEDYITQIEIPVKGAL